MQRRGHILVDWRCLCQRSLEDVNHLLIHCEVSKLWKFALMSFGVSWIFWKKVSDLLMGWRNWLGKHALNVWNLVPLALCVMWIIWRKQNSHIVKD